MIIFFKSIRLLYQQKSKNLKTYCNIFSILYTYDQAWLIPVSKAAKVDFSNQCSMIMEDTNQNTGAGAPQTPSAEPTPTPAPTEGGSGTPNA